MIKVTYERSVNEPMNTALSNRFTYASSGPIKTEGT
jgi:hypothetical protein